MDDRETTPLAELDEAVDACRACDLWARATQGVAGEGPRQPRLVLVGEQPGNDEDLQGRPFVGPAGMLLRRALADAGIAPADVYLTNAVKHFKWIGKGKRRIHDKPSAREVRACRPWLTAELRAIAPELIVALGATAAQSLLGAAVRVTKQRGQVLAAEGGAHVFVTVHPSSILRSTDDEERRAAYALFVADLAAAARVALPTAPHRR